MELLKEFAKVGKENLSKISTILKVNEENRVFKKVYNDKKMDKCINDCPYFVDKKSNEVTFENSFCNTCDAVNENYTYEQLKTTKYSGQSFRLSKLQIKLYLFYHFCQVKKFGFIFNLNEVETANFLKCSVKSIRNCNERLQDLHLIAMSNVKNHNFTVKIYGYEHYHDTKEKKGKGYILMPIEQFDVFLEVEDVNALRIQLKQLLKTDYDNFIKKDVSTYKIKEIKDVLPKYISNCKVEKIVNNHKTPFKTTIKDNFIEFSLIKDYNGKVLRERKEYEYETEFNKILINNKIKPEELIIFNVDLVKLSFEYGFDIVKKSIIELLPKLNFDEIYNFGGCLRKYIRNNYGLYDFGGYLDEESEDNYIDLIVA